ncbi:MAG: hypothetical protein HKL80_07370 [Acidimicrobiales bacterium]|nr:hypothetical protein [Acidimicrobiales bacterium]
MIQGSASTGQPVSISMGMSTIAEVALFENATTTDGNGGAFLLYVSSACHTPASDLELVTIPLMISIWNMSAGNSDHSLGVLAPVAAVTSNKTIVEKHLTLRQPNGWPDREFSAVLDDCKKPGLLGV